MTTRIVCTREEADVAECVLRNRAEDLRHHRNYEDAAKKLLSMANALRDADEIRIERRKP